MLTNWREKRDHALERKSCFSSLVKKNIIFKANAVKELEGIHTICKDFERSLDYLGFSGFICNTWFCIYGFGTQHVVCLVFVGWNFSIPGRF